MGKKWYNTQEMALVTVLHDYLINGFAKYLDKEANQDTKDGLLHIIHDASCIVAQIISNYKGQIR